MTEGKIWTIDRIEDGETAVLLSGSADERRVPVAELPGGAKEGDALRELPQAAGPDEGAAERESSDGEGEAGPRGSVRYAPDPEATERLRSEAEDLRDSLRRGPSGPLSL